MKHWRHLDRDARIAAVIRLRDLGHSRSAIAAELRVTTNALHGFCFRQQIDGVGSAKPLTGGWHDLDTPAKVERITTMIAAGKSALEIAADLGLSKGSVYRFCWSQGISVTNKKVTIKPRPPEVQDGRPLRPDAWIPIGEPVSLLANEGCCWPVDGGYCGKPKDKKSYCQRHHAMAYPRQARALDEAKIDFLAREDDRSANRRERVSLPVERMIKREAVRYDDDE